MQMHEDRELRCCEGSQPWQDVARMLHQLVQVCEGAPLLALLAEEHLRSGLQPERGAVQGCKRVMGSSDCPLAICLGGMKHQGRSSSAARSIKRSTTAGAHLPLMAGGSPSSSELRSLSVLKEPNKCHDYRTDPVTSIVVRCPNFRWYINPPRKKAGSNPSTSIFAQICAAAFWGRNCMATNCWGATGCLSLLHLART